MKILGIADLHGFTLDEIEKIYRLNPNNIDLVAWLGDNDSYVIKNIKEHLDKVNHIGVLGNYETHDNLTENGILNINRRFIKEQELSFVGFEGCYKEDNDNRWVYGYSQKQSITTAFKLPKADVVLSHTSPMGVNQNKPEHPGLIGISDYIKIHKPRLVLHGHQHINKTTLLNNGTLVVGIYGATIVDTDSLAIMNILRKN